MYGQTMAVSRPTCVGRFANQRVLPSACTRCAKHFVGRVFLLANVPCREADRKEMRSLDRPYGETVARDCSLLIISFYFARRAFSLSLSCYRVEGARAIAPESHGTCRCTYMAAIVWAQCGARSGERDFRHSRPTAWEGNYFAVQRWRMQYSGEKLFMFRLFLPE